MPGFPRRMVVTRGEVAVYHCWNRCVQRAWLCGHDPYTGIDYEYRRQAIEEVEQQLAQWFAIDICFGALQANHLHVILRTRPDIAAELSDDEILRRWLLVVRLKRGVRLEISEPSPKELEKARRRWTNVNSLRQRLADISWFMGALCEHLSRRFNRESGTSGAFWEHRFGCRRLDDEGALLLCGVYVDLNPIRAGEALIPEEARYTSAYHRIKTLQQQRNAGEADPGETPAPDAWLCPLTLREDDPSQLGPVPAQQRWRASDKGLLSLSLEKYLEILDWTGRQLRSADDGAIPATLAPILQRLGIRTENWLKSLYNLDRQFGHFVGSLAHLNAVAERIGRRWLRGAAACTTAFG